MFKKVFTIILSVILLAISSGLNVVSAQLNNVSGAEKVKTKVESLGVGARVEVKLQDKTKYKGHINAIENDGFAIAGGGTNTRIDYEEVDDIKKAGGGWSAKNWIILGSAVAGAIVTWAIVKPALCDGGAQTRGPC